jgi:hypothetical protein
MSAVKETWEVKPHGPVEEVDDGLLTVVQDIRLPLCTFPRRMTVARLAEGGTAIFSAIALDEAGMARIEAMGTPAALIVPNAVHRLDARIWKQRYPAIRVLAPPGARQRAEEAVPVDATDDALGDPQVRFVVVPGTGGGEAALEVRRADGLTLVINDLIGNVREPHDFVTGIIVRLMGFGGAPPGLPRLARLMLVKDKAALAAQLAAWAGEPGLRRILVSHGDPIERDAAAVLRGIASSLG